MSMPVQKSEQVGVVLFCGNITGAFPTFRYAGYVVMGIGSLIWGISEAW